MFFLEFSCFFGDPIDVPNLISGSSAISKFHIYALVYKLVLEKAEEPEIKLPTSTGSSKKHRSYRKTSALLTTPKPLTVWITTNGGKSFKRWEYQTTLPAF